ncbi:hypothetical protein C1645_838733 [Glomus cerebriforme]|uniref:Uncharacterized protein n=1 Tax=Glomus cerebriforme TaxID=658196 RepID=A0A397SCG6_9GLOM|nr:hypothetical protein C1645_838733 [Glomus cerebriforme]
MSCYSKTIALITSDDTCWNSYYFCFHNILKTEAILKALITKCSSEHIGTPSSSQTRTSHQHYKTDTMNLLLPLCDALNKLQKNVARLYEIAHYFGWIIKIFASHEDEEFGDHMISRLESCLAQWEQLLLLLSIILHPNEESDGDVDDSFKNVNNNNTSIINSEQWTKMIENWIEIVNTEEIQEDFIGESDKRPYDFEVSEHDTHPADNVLAK